MTGKTKVGRRRYVPSVPSPKKRGGGVGVGVLEGGECYVGFRSMRCPLGKPCLSFPAPAWHRPPPGFALWGLKSSFWRVSRSGVGGKNQTPTAAGEGERGNEVFPGALSSPPSPAPLRPFCRDISLRLLPSSEGGRNPPDPP